MRIAVASDHRGVRVKGLILDQLRGLEHEVIDMGPEESSPVDYPVYASKVAEAVSNGSVDRGILICGSGIGISIAANKVHGIRAALCHNAYTAEMARRHNDANVIAMGGRVVDENTAIEMTRIFLNTDFEGGRHARRVEKLNNIQ